MRRVLAFGVLVMALSSALQAAPLDPTAFTSLGTMNLAAGTYTVNTDAMTLTGPSTNFTGVASGNICVFTFDSITIASGAVINCRGSRCVAFLSQSTVSISGTINADGESAQTGFTSYTPLGGAGGGSGGAAGFSGALSGGPGGGPGGGTQNDLYGGAGGGGFGTNGARGGDAIGYSGQNGGTAYGNLSNQLQGGSGGGGGEQTGGGGGGGGVEVGAVGNITITVTGIISANGGHGEVANYGASGGGSGGGVIVASGAAMTLAGTIRVRGGDGGRGGC